MEIRTIPAYPKYKACSNGDIIGSYGGILTPHINSNEYVSVNLCPVGKRSVHRLMANAFLELDINDNLIEVHHKDENPSNNNIDNLELLTKAEHNSKKYNYKYENNTLTHKVCSICNKLLDRYLFGKSPGCRDGLDNRCKQCVNITKLAQQRARRLM